MHLCPLLIFTLVTFASDRALPPLGERGDLGPFTDGTGNVRVGSEPSCPPDQQGPLLIRSLPTRNLPVRNDSLPQVGPLAGGRAREAV